MTQVLERPAVDNSAADIYDRAADVIVERGLHQGGYYYDLEAESSADCGVCIYGALAVVLFNNAELGYKVNLDDGSIGGHLRDVIGERVGIDRYASVVGFNDNPHTTQDDVVGVLRETASRLRAA